MEVARAALAVVQHDPDYLLSVYDAHKCDRSNLLPLPKVSVLGVGEQRVNVIGDLIDSFQLFGDAYRVDTRIVVWQGRNVLKAPISSLFRCDQSAWCVFVAE